MPILHPNRIARRMGRRLALRQTRDMNAPVRVVMLEVPKLLRDILEHAIRQDSDYALEQGGEPEVSPDVVILGLTAAEDAALVTTLLARWPGAQVLTMLQTGQDAVVHELNPRRRPLGEISAAEMLVTLHDSVLRRRELAGKSFTG